MGNKVKITILKSEIDEKLAKRYAIPNFGACPFHRAGQLFFSDGENKPDGLCDYAWEPMFRPEAGLECFDKHNC